MVLVLMSLVRELLVLLIQLVSLSLGSLNLKDLLQEQESRQVRVQTKHQERLVRLASLPKKVYWVVAVKALTP